MAIRKSIPCICWPHLLAEEEGIVKPLLDKIGVNRAQLDRIVESELNHLPQQSGHVGQPGMSLELNKVFEAAQREAGTMKDDFISTEHLLLALTKVDSKAKNVLKLNAITENELLAAMKTVRGSSRVTDMAPEAKFQALQKYGIDLVDRAGKASSIPSSAAIRKSAASSKSSPAAQKTIRC